ncbi:LPS-assembly protein LptD [Pseudodonghicola flavimaris]|uniref:LPS-assembly protein LptD n=1 Tax=Pseudodonghicola flavimaris TaxID=3050036 RepID=A0ABT7EVS2_9RHOB|nr:LPS assembly protein LptD [Pseudodonghicola flavimaris]MDK3016385.1 LPS assembly protein LptD [Pseudodonghicola flavimaris]
MNLNGLIPLALIAALSPALPARLAAQSLPPAPAIASETEVTPAMLVADSVFITPERRLVAEGHVEAFQGDTRLSASKITFDRETGRLDIEGPIRIDQGDNMTVLADAAELDRELQNGLLQGARMVFDQQVQLASLQMMRVGGRYTQLYKTTVTSCHVCGDGRPPLWQIRAQSVTHDQQERQLYFKGAQLRVLDVPVFYFPAMRLPDPSLDRATGFLIPSIRTTSQLGTGIKVPYFFRIGDSRDLTVTPYLSPKTETLGLRYRQAFRHGRIEVEGAYTRDDLLPDESRGYMFATGEFDLGNRFKLNFDLKTASDNAYLVDYGLHDYDRLRSQVELSRATRDSLLRAAAIHYDSLRDGEDEALIPTRIADFSYQHRLFPQALGGELRLGLDSRAYQRTSPANITGRDVARITADAEWRRSWIFNNGLRADWRMGFSADRFNISDDTTYGNEITRTTPRAALTLRYPMTLTNSGGVTHFLEPLMQLGWTDVNGPAAPIDESRFVEFDQGNLLSLSRFPSGDAREDGTTLVMGVNWARYAPAGWQAAATVAQVFRGTADANFSTTSGLADGSSDVLLAGQLRTQTGLALTARGLLDDSFSFSKMELRGDWAGKRIALRGSYLWLGTDTAEGRSEDLSELWFDGSYQVTQNWTASANLRYDIASDNATYAGVGLIYRNECVTVDLSVNRRYTSSSSVEPSTDFGFTIALSGFAVESGTVKYRRSCGKS